RGIGVAKGAIPHLEWREDLNEEFGLRVEDTAALIGIGQLAERGRDSRCVHCGEIEKAETFIERRTPKVVAAEQAALFGLGHIAQQGTLISSLDVRRLDLCDRHR